MLQWMRLKRFAMPFAVLGLCSFISSHTGGLKLISIYEPLVIKAQKNSPAHAAFEELILTEKSQREWTLVASAKPQLLIAGKNLVSPIYSRRLLLTEMVLTKTPEAIATSSDQKNSTTNDSEWISQLSNRQSYRLEEAQRRSDVLSTNWSDAPTWKDLAKAVIDKNSAQSEAQGPQGARKVFIASRDSSGVTRTSVPGASVLPASDEPAGDEVFTRSAALTQNQIITGPLEITGGLAVTNEHHIEIVRNDDGVSKGNGTVDLRKGSYSIAVDGKSGVVVARLVTKEGKVLGEGSFRLSHLSQVFTASVQGPKIKITPQPDFAAVVSNAYDSRPGGSIPQKTVATFIKGEHEVTLKKEGLIAMDDITKGSSTILRVAAPHFLQTAALINSGTESKVQIFSESMIDALEEIISQQRQISLDGQPTIIWGKIAQDGKPTAGVEVVLESDMSLEPVYFNQFLLPDPSLKSTSENGLFAFVGAPTGFHSLLATRAGSIFGYQNVVAEEGSVAQGDIDSTIKFEVISMKSYDAFSGEAQPVSASLQSLQDEVEMPTGAATISLPHLNRSGMLRLKPEGVDYISARYLYNDNDLFIHLPLIRWAWLNSIKTYLRIDDSPSAGVVVGFVPDEDFEVFIAGYEKFESKHIVYFDTQGRILSDRKGLSGGGFILYNVPEDTHEIVVVGARTQKIYSRVLPVDANSLSVLSFRE